MSETTPATVRGPLKYEIETSSPMVEAGRPFTVYLRVTNPYEVKLLIRHVEFPLPIEFVDETFVDQNDSLRIIEPPPPKRSGGTANPFAPHVAMAMAATGSNRRPTGTVEAQRSADGSDEWRAAMAEVEIQPGNTVTQKITLRTRRWVMFSPAAYHLEAQLAYEIDGKEHRDAVKMSLSIKAPMIALIIGAAIGAAAGGLLQYLYRSPALSWTGLGQALIPICANIVLSGVVIVAFGRKKDTQPFISVEDFWGALFVGFLVGTGGQEWLDFLTAGTPGGAPAASSPASGGG